MVKINGEFKEEIGVSLIDYLKKNGYNKAMIAVEINGVIIKKSEYENTTLQDGDSVEIVSFVGGG